MKLGTTELLVLLLVVVIIFGPTQIPKLTKMFGKSIKGFREGMGMDEADSDSKDKVAKDDDKE
jgi:sec-independent protein translocase protein TatA